MNYISVSEWAQAIGVSERTARNYCLQGKIPGAVKVGRNWCLPENTEVPKRGNVTKVSHLLTILREEKKGKVKGRLYHRVQIDLTYNSNHIEGSKLSHDQTRYIFETNTVGVEGKAIRVDDIIETTNHFRAIDFIIDNTESRLTEAYIKHLHFLLKSGTSDERREWFSVGEYKKLPNEVGGNDTTSPENVGLAMKNLLREYNAKEKPSFEDILDFHHRFEAIHPFQDGNGRVGRLIMFRETLRLGFVPFIITDELKMFYYKGLRNWPQIKGYLMDTCLTAQDSFKEILTRLRINFER